jgi:glutamate-ammonia-ligase adenylyltransferase
MLVRNPKLVEMLMRLGDASKFLAETIRGQPELFDEVCQGATLSDPKNLDRMYAELLAAQSDDVEPMEMVRRWKRAELLRIGIEDVMGLVDVEQLHLEMTCLAEACLRFSLEQARNILKLAKFPFAVIGVGKFGGKELGYGADLDVLFIGGKGAEDQKRASALAAEVIEFMSKHTASGSLFAIDARLRPEGASGPLAGSLQAHADYYAQRAQLWERQALTKARFVAGDVELGKKFSHMVVETIYARTLSDAELEEIRKMRHRIETERVDQKHAGLEFKTGAGGLIDVEFIVQALQLRHGHAHPQLRTAHTLAALNRLTSFGIVDEEDSSQLRRHYLFLRRIESTLRRVDNKSISRIPGDEVEQVRLAKRLGYDGREEFLEAYTFATRQTRGLYERLMK